MVRHKIFGLGLETCGTPTMSYQSLGIGLATMVLWRYILPMFAS